MKRRSVPKDYDYKKLAANYKAASMEMKGRKTGKFTFSRYPLAAKPYEVAATRAKLHLSRGKFADVLGVSEDTIKYWEKGKRNPDGPATKLIRMLGETPELAKRLVIVS